MGSKEWAGGRREADGRATGRNGFLKELGKWPLESWCHSGIYLKRILNKVPERDYRNLVFGPTFRRPA